MQESIEQSPVVPASKPKVRYSVWFKLLAVLVALAGALNAALAVLQSEKLNLVFQPGDYAGSNDYRAALLQVVEDARFSALEYSTEADASGPYAQQEASARQETSQKLDELKAQYQTDLANMESAQPMVTATPQAGEDQSVEISLQTPTPGPAEVTEQRQQLKEQYDEQVVHVNQTLDSQLKQIQSNRQTNDDRAAQCTQRLNTLEGILYGVQSVQGVRKTNIEKNGDLSQLFEPYKHKMVMQKKSILSSEGQSFYGLDEVPEGATIYVAMTDERFALLKSRYEADRTAGEMIFYKVLAGLLAALAGVAWLLYTAGRRPVLSGVVMTGFDWLFLDVQLAVLGGVLALCIAGIVNLVSSYYPPEDLLNLPAIVICYQGLFAVALLSALLFLTSVAKRAKRGELLRHTLVFVVLRFIWRGIKRLFLGLRVSARYVLAYLGFAFFYGLFAMLFGRSMAYGYLDGLSVVLFFMGSLLVVAALSFVLHKAISFKNLSTAVRRIQAGELGVRVPTGGGSDLSQLANSVNNLADGLKAAVDSEVKAERMRAELVTNVSHDLKTPLTSIVTYVDLLKTEGLTSENAPHYLDVIDQKAARLRTLTADLFEAAKAASGTMPVNLERVDANALLAQGLSELSDRIVASGLDMKLQLPADRLLLRADGRLLWRVMENLLSNVFKYAMTGSRVYLTAGRLGGRGVLTLKNISAYELNIAPEELTERFTRGDASRHSEGSGLGLSIARSLTELQGGELRIEIDGDLFKVIVTLPVWEE